MIKTCRSSVNFEHPAKAGHFPEHPIVPGVIVLEKVLDCAKNFSAVSVFITKIETVKFHRTMEFGATFEIEFTYDTIERITFRCHAKKSLIAEGTLLFEKY